MLVFKTSYFLTPKIGSIPVDNSCIILLPEYTMLDKSYWQSQREWADPSSQCPKPLLCLLATAVNCSIEAPYYFHSKEYIFRHYYTVIVCTCIYYYSTGSVRESSQCPKPAEPDTFSPFLGCSFSLHPFLPHSFTSLLLTLDTGQQEQE